MNNKGAKKQSYGLQLPDWKQVRIPTDVESLAKIVVDALLPIHTAQVVTYLRLKKFPLGLLINFNEVLIKNGIHRILNVPRSPKEVLA